MTKVEAVKKLLEDKGGVAALETIYNEIEKYYPAAKAARTWKAGLRGVINRDIYADKNFKRAGYALVALNEYREEKNGEIAWLN